MLFYLSRIKKNCTIFYFTFVTNQISEIKFVEGKCIKNVVNIILFCFIQQERGITLSE